ncbi:MAG: VWA domain-containing protein [Gemmatimonadaceae bacterium]
MTARVDWPWFLPVAAVLAIVIGALVVIGWRRRRKRLTKFAAPALLMQLVPDQAWRRPGPRAWRLGTAALLALVALAGPRWGEERTLVRGEGVDLVLALDASLSMTATDERPSRLERMKQEVRRLRAMSGGDRVALLAFAGRSYILTPLTVDDGALDLFLENLDPSIVGQAGSSLARTISQAVELLQTTQGAGDRAIVLMSDGEAFEPEGDIAEAARKAGEAGIPIIAVGFGTEQGSTIPLRDGDRIVPKRDDEGQVVITKYTPLMLRAAADESHGTFIDASESDKASRIRQALRSLRASGRTVQSGREYTRRFQLFLLPALLLLLLDTWLADRATRRRLLMAAGLLVTLQGCVWRNDPSAQGARAFRSGNYTASVALYRSAVRRDAGSAQALYNLGTAMVANDSAASAIEPLERAVRPEPTELRFRALFNYGLAHLKRGLAGADGADSTKQELEGALDGYKRALLMRPGDMDAKWNYELALRKQKSGGGGGGGGGSNQSNAQPQDQQQNEKPSGGLGQQQAEQLLNSAARDERGVQGKKQKQTRPPPKGGRDW